MIEISLGQRLHELRDRADLSLHELAKKVGISGPFLSDIELGRRFPSEEILAKLAKVLNVSLEDLKQYDNRELERQSLLPSYPAPIRIERFVEKEFKTALRYEDLGPDNLGCTIFNSSGAVEAILVSRSLEEQNTIPARRRVRSTVAHEAGHGLLHGSLFIEGNFPDLRENQRRIPCRSEDILVETQRSYRGRWWEFQANQAIGSLLLPKSLMNAFLDQAGIKFDSSGNRILTPVQRESLAKKAATIFDVNPIVARIRLDSLFS
jgi:transcriptional regulator with XRE-family HTH domain